MTSGFFDQSRAAGGLSEARSCSGGQSNEGRIVLLDWVAALALTAVGAALASFLAGGLPAIGIDDAAITRSYAENLANGLGYVYNAGGERVEGSTSFLWTMMVAFLYWLTPEPEILVLLLAGLMTAFAVFNVFQLCRALSERLRASPQISVAALWVALLGSPGYFLWSVWSMMEVALWSCMVMLLVRQLIGCVEAGPKSGAALSFGTLVPAIALPLSRPEGVAVSVGIIALGTLLDRRLRLPGLILMSASLSAFAAVTLFRIWYFGQPFPNTFYAKVSSDRMQDLIDGLKYANRFVLRAPFVEAFIVAWVAAATWGIQRAYKGVPGSRGLLVGAAAVFGFLAIYACLGGDHFALWRFYQPVVPLVPVAFAIGVALLFRILPLGAAARTGTLSISIVAAATYVLIGSMQYRVNRFDVTKEFRLNQQGIEFGTYLNEVSPRPSIGVGPAGGIALGYDGYIYDLLGLNWVEMAHANPVKVGMRNHASFDKPTFWKYSPDVIANFNRPCTEGGTQQYWASNDDAFGGLFGDAEFRRRYRPVLFRQQSKCWPGFATPEWLEMATHDPSLTVMEWSDIVILR